MSGGAQSTVVCILTAIHGADCPFTMEEVNMHGGIFLFVKRFGFQCIIAMQAWFANTTAPINHLYIAYFLIWQSCVGDFSVKIHEFNYANSLLSTCRSVTSCPAAPPSPWHCVSVIT